MRRSTAGDTANAVQARFLHSYSVLDDKRIPRPRYLYGIQIGTTGFEVDSVEKFPHSEMTKYWLRCFAQFTSHSRRGFTGSARALPGTLPDQPEANTRCTDRPENDIHNENR
ncbi:hypothetical protein [Nocardia pseudovaccinii]|uniref:hypothetical protein n=1 Tax=Nocardia pseudovaccinii TaxID=189540 RepID=UPI0007A4AAE0|nr:hypothetical protein [Nocardia pseudovaccinii]